MLSERHPTTEELRQWRRGAMEGEEVITIARHVAACAHCQGAASERLGLDEAVDALWDDLSEAPAESAPSTDWRWARNGGLALAATLAIVFASAAWWMARTPRPIDPGGPLPSRPPVIHTATVLTATALTATIPAGESNALLDALRKGGPLGMPGILRALQSEAESVRGMGERSAVLAPAGIVLKTARPLFSWPAATGSQSVVRIFAGEREVARSRSLTGTQWRPERGLSRGATYAWNVRVERNNDMEILPAAPAPVARFHIVDEATLTKLNAAERDHPADHLLLGVMHAEAGLVDDARDQLRLVTDPPDAAVARRLLLEIEAWGTQ